MASRVCSVQIVRVCFDFVLGFALHLHLPLLFTWLVQTVRVLFLLCTWLWCTSTLEYWLLRSYYSQHEPLMQKIWKTLVKNHKPMKRCSHCGPSFVTHLGWSCLRFFRGQLKFPSFYQNRVQRMSPGGVHCQFLSQNMIDLKSNFNIVLRCCQISLSEMLISTWLI